MTLYSLVAITQRWRGDSRAELTSTALFGNPAAGLRHDFPSHLGTFAKITGGAYGTPIDLALRHTVLPYFTLFRNRDVLSKAVATMAGPSVERLKFDLGLPASSMGASFPLGYCPECLRQDEETIGYAYWHCIHQIPGAHICPVHLEAVLRARIRLNGLGRTRSVLPADHEITKEARSFDLPPAARGILGRISALSQSALAGDLPGQYDALSLQACYRFGLAQQGWLTRAGSVRATEFVKAFACHFRPIALIPPFDRLVSGSHAEATLCLVRKPRNNSTPLAHLLLIEFLFGDWNRFVAAYEWEKQLALPFDEPQDAAKSRVASVSAEFDESLRRIADAYRNGDTSLSALCREHGVDLDTAMRWLGRRGLAKISRRPRIVTDDVRNKAEALLNTGRTLREICSLLSLSKATVDRILNASPTLHESWQLERHARRREIERGKLERFFESHPDATMRDVRTTPGAGYSWLSRNDRDWFRKRVPKPARAAIREHKRRARVDWSVRDQQCLFALKIVAANLELAHHEILKSPAILRRLTELPFKPRLSRLPISKCFVEELLTLQRARRFES